MREKNDEDVGIFYFVKLKRERNFVSLTLYFEILSEWRFVVALLRVDAGENH